MVARWRRRRRARVVRAVAWRHGALLAMAAKLKVIRLGLGRVAVVAAVSRLIGAAAGVAALLS